jgi:hypothetical protein
MEIKFNDWQDLSLKKDVELILKKLSSQKSNSFVITIEFILTIFSLTLSYFSSELSNELRIYLGISIIILAVFLPLLVYFGFCIWNHFVALKRIFKKDFPSTKFVDIFDNRICYYSMMANSFYECATTPNISSEIKKFDWMEGNYYINKCISEFHNMTSYVKMVFFDDSSSNENPFIKKISLSRLRNILEVLKLCRDKFKIQFELDRVSVNHDLLMEEFLLSFQESFKSFTFVW